MSKRVLMYSSSKKGFTGVDLVDGETVWVAYYTYSYSGYRCTGKLEPKEVEVTSIEGYYLDKKLNTTNYFPYYMKFFMNEQDAVNYYNQEVHGHIEHLKGKINKVSKALTNCVKAIHGDPVKVTGDVKQFLYEKIQSFED